MFTARMEKLDLSAHTVVAADRQNAQAHHVPAKRLGYCVAAGRFSQDD